MTDIQDVVVKPAYVIVDNYVLPETSKTRNREKGEFALAVDSLAVDQGFEFDSEIKLKAHYSRIAPRKFAGKRFTVVQIGENRFAVKRKS